MIPKIIKKYYQKYPKLFIIIPITALIGSVCFVQILDRTRVHRKKRIEYLVVHYTANDHENADAMMNALYLQRKRNAGAHYCIDDKPFPDGVIQTTKEDMVSYSIGDRYWSGFQPKPWLVNANGSRKVLNHNSLNFEMCLGGGRNDSITIENTAQMVGWQLVNKGLDITRVLRHHDVTGKRCPYFNYEIDSKGRIDISKWNQIKEDSAFNVFLEKVKKYQEYHIARKEIFRLK